MLRKSRIRHIQGGYGKPHREPFLKNIAASSSLPPSALFSCFSDLNGCPIKGDARITLPMKGELNIGLQTGLFFHHA